MSRRIHRSGAPADASSSSSDEEDAFTALARRKSKKQKTTDRIGLISSGTTDQKKDEATPTSISLLKQDASAARKQKMDALVEELLETSQSIPLDTKRRVDSRGTVVRGSFVLPGEEHLTTNLFVGNLPPSITEDEVAQLFSQFGELYSVKVMYPRTAEERARDRHSGFVCFWNRQDAQDALSACNDRDVFGKGRRLHMNWGRKVDMKGIPRGMTAARPVVNATNTAVYDPRIHGQTSIQIELPTDPAKIQLITTVASFVAKDGSQLENELIKLHRLEQAPELAFLLYQSETESDHCFYKWRVYSFAQGDSWNVWRTDPFQMIRDGCFWIPPPMQEEAARREMEAKRSEQLELERQKQQRRLLNIKQDVLTGRQIENIYNNKLGELSHEDRKEFDRLIHEELCGARQSILKVMAFCFEKSTAADQIAGILKEWLSDTGDCDVEDIIARLFLLSDILFNSQQPGVKNAFRYRDAIERMSPDLFTSLYHYGQTLGRMTLNKLARAVRNVLEAWRSWDVFHSVFLDDLHSRFDTGEAKPEEERNLDTEEPPESLAGAPDSEGQQNATNAATMSAQSVSTGQRFEEIALNEGEDEEEDIDGEPIVDDEEEGRERTALHSTVINGPSALFSHKFKEKICNEGGDDDEDIDGESIADEEEVGQQVTVSSVLAGQRAEETTVNEGGEEEEEEGEENDIDGKPRAEDEDEVSDGEPI